MDSAVDKTLEYRKFYLKTFYQVVYKRKDLVIKGEGLSRNAGQWRLFGSDWGVRGRDSRKLMLADLPKMLNFFYK